MQLPPHLPSPLSFPLPHTLLFLFYELLRRRHRHRQSARAPPARAPVAAPRARERRRRRRRRRRRAAFLDDEDRPLCTTKSAPCDGRTDGQTNPGLNLDTNGA